jgi:hypothetical protein
MSQSYTPGTILSTGFGETLEEVVMLTGDRVATKTYAGNPVTRRDILSLDDWKILMSGMTIRESYIPVPQQAQPQVQQEPVQMPLNLPAQLPQHMPRPAETFAAPPSGRGYLADLQASAEAGSSSAILEMSSVLKRLGVSTVEQAMAMTTLPASGTSTPDTLVAAPEPEPEPAAEPEPEAYPIGTFLRWKDGDSNSRTAIVLKDGVLQVKERINGELTLVRSSYSWYNVVAKKFFPSVAEWRASLPQGGAVTTEAGQDCSVPSIKRKATKPIEAVSDVDYIKKIQDRYRVYAKLTQDLSPMESREKFMASLRERVADIQTRLSSSYLQNMKDGNHEDNTERLTRIYKTSLSIKHFAVSLLCTHRAIMAKPEEVHLGRFHFRNGYKQRIVGFLNGTEVEICSSMGFIGLAYDKATGLAGKWAKPTLGKTFAELGLDMKEDKPRLKVYYRRQTVEL